MSDTIGDLVESLGVLSPPAPQVERRRTRLPWHQRLMAAFSSYLPVLLMGVLALGTWWLVKNTPLPEVDKPPVAARHEPDYTMTAFTVQRFAADGAMRVHIEGDRLRHFPDTDTLEIDNPRIRAVAPDGRITIASARSALSNGDGSEIQLSGGAQVRREALAGEHPIEFRSEFLHAFLSTERVRSHLPVVVKRGGTELRAGAMDYDNLARVIDLKGRTRAVFAAPTPAGRPAP